MLDTVHVSRAISPLRTLFCRTRFMKVLHIFVLYVSHIGSRQFHGLSYFKNFVQRHVRGQQSFLYFLII